MLKRFFKKLLLCLLSIFGRRGPMVLFYHDVGRANTSMGTPLDVFKAQIAYAKRHGYTFSSTLREMDARQGRNLMICFDDGFRGVLDVKTFLLENGIRPVIFVAIGLVGKPGYLTWEELIELQSVGFRIGSHTWSHQTLSGSFIAASPKAVRTRAWYEHELRESRLELEKRLGSRVTEFCFPAGHFTDEVIKACVSAGYENLYTSIPGSIHWSLRLQKNIPDAIRLVHRNLCQFSDVLEFGAILRGALEFMSGRYLRLHYGKGDVCFASC